MKIVRINRRKSAFGTSCCGQLLDLKVDMGLAEADIYVVFTAFLRKYGICIRFLCLFSLLSLLVRHLPSQPLFLRKIKKRTDIR